MNKLLRYSFVALLAMMFGNVMADEVSWDWATASYNNDASANLVTWSSEHVTLTLAKGTSSTAANNFLGGGSNSHTRVYKNQVLTFTPASAYAISSIEITAVAGSSYVSNFTGATWTNGSAVGEDTKITITPIDGSKAVSCVFGGATRATLVKVIYSADTDSRTSTTIAFADGYQTQIGGGPDGMFPQVGQSVALPTATVKAGDAAVAGATIEWSLEVQSWKEGKAAPTIEAGKIKFVDGAYGEVLVKASYAGNDSYKPSHKNYTLKVYKSYGLLSEMVNDIADPNFEKDDQDDKDGTLVFYFFRNIDAGLQSVQNTVTYVNGSYIYLTDGEKNLLFYGSNSQKLKAGDVISGNVDENNLGGFWGSLKRYNKLPEFAFTNMNVKVESSGAAPEPTTISADQLKDYINAYVKIQNAVFESASNKNFVFKIGEKKLKVYNQWYVADQSEEAAAEKKLVVGATYTLTGMGNVYKKGTADADYQLYLAGFEKTADPSSVNAIKTNAQFSGKMYNVAGQVVNKGYKGLVIQDGRKFVNK